ncbi:hypothetical protein JCM30760_15230 [Thiomicrorhabdus hydrogeniphila]
MFLIISFPLFFQRFIPANIVATATGQIVPTGKSKTSQPAKASQTKLSKVLPITQKHKSIESDGMDTPIIQNGFTNALSQYDKGVISNKGACP